MYHQLLYIQHPIKTNFSYTTYMNWDKNDHPYTNPYMKHEKTSTIHTRHRIRTSSPYTNCIWTIDVHIRAIIFVYETYTFSWNSVYGSYSKFCSYMVRICFVQVYTWPYISYCFSWSLVIVFHGDTVRIGRGLRWCVEGGRFAEMGGVREESKPGNDILC